MNNVLGIVKQTDGQFRCRGIGPKYDAFYKWLSGTSYECTAVDWPWDYFKFNDPRDEDRMRDMWGNDMMKDDIE